ncbi:hypothetical protein POSPLADRAFT_1050210 [Postia placenta MAD-698-R-SB12]|uniref:EF-hand domain-containing protein n=1 Tax=Postia placenta MAD-698-R-SB12 TaxID=670580 RepID=A0A1X6MLA7_9APHY|nr:hypothetical protein POSPLADRAFT_1050210 [Postia placenta MAD-698-R-SB12]OSX57145.1 hypothetical protein POSPLADRAFT_1050210 [Postia placenta MAD-698-R-SB12]
MTLPRLLRRLSRKSIDKLSAFDAPVPPVPELSPTPDTLSPTSDVNSERTAVNYFSSPLQSPTSVVSVPEDIVSQSITAAAKVITRHEEESKNDRLLGKLDDKITVVTTATSYVTAVAAPVKAALDAIYKLEEAKKSNDDTVKALYIKMKDMMDVLLQLRDVRDPTLVGPNGLTAKPRMQELVEHMAGDIKDCGNACDAYSRVKPVTKVLLGPVWVGRLSKFIDVFAQRRQDFEFALSIHTGRGVDEVNRKMDELNEQTKQFAEMFEHFMKTCIPPGQAQLVDFVQAKGGPQAVLQDEEALRQLSARQSTSTSRLATASVSTGRTRHKEHLARITGEAADPKDDFKRLHEELALDPEAVIENNMKLFQPRFEMQQKHLLEEMESIVHRESDRVIDAVNSGPHVKVVDKAWRGSVKARHLALALRDHYQERAEKRENGGHRHRTRSDADAWALEWISLKRLQPIIDAIDDDASGFITISEVNNFTTSRPVNWSLPQRLAYWSIGWQAFSTVYAHKIEALLGKMFALRNATRGADNEAIRGKIAPAFREANCRSVDHYLEVVWSGTIMLTRALQKVHVEDSLLARFQSYIDSEEDRMKSNLEHIKYHIDGMHTLLQVMGSGRIERYLFPMLYLFLRRDLEIIRLCHKKVIQPAELNQSAANIIWLLEAVAERHTSLEETFREQNIDVAQQFSATSCGLFAFWHDDTALFGREHMRNFPFHDTLLEDWADKPHMPPEAVLNYPLSSEYPYDCATEAIPPFEETKEDMTAEPLIGSIIGPWTGFMVMNDEFPAQPTFHLNIHASSERGRFEASGIASDGAFFRGSGTVTFPSDSDGPLYIFKMMFDRSCVSVWTLNGSLNDDGETLSGSWGYNSSDRRNVFVFSRTRRAVETTVALFLDIGLSRNRALWQFAISSVVERIRRQAAFWRSFKQQRFNRSRYIELMNRRRGFGRHLDSYEDRELERCLRSLSALEARTYETFRLHRLRTTPSYLCGGNILGSRIVCIDCDVANTVDLCDDPRCSLTRVDLERRPDLPSPHLSSHSVFKVRKMLHLKDFGKVDSAAREALKRATATLRDGNDIDPKETENVKDTFICTSCDAKGAVSIGQHRADHALVKCGSSGIGGPSLTIEHRLEVLERRFGAVDHKLAQLDVRLDFAKYFTPQT